MSEVIALCWHPSHDQPVKAGGFTRFYEIASRTTGRLTIIDKYPSSFKPLSSNIVTVIEYRIPNLAKLPSLLSAIADRAFSTYHLILKILSLPVRSYIFYVPASELPQLSLAGIFAKYLTSSRLVMTNLNVNVYTIDRLINIATHALADKIITISQSLKQDLFNTGIRATAVNGVGFDVAPYKKIQRQSKQSIAVYIGRHDPQKGILDLFRIWRKIMDDLPEQANLKLITAGNIPQVHKSDIDKLIADLKLENSVTMLGSISDQAKIDLLHKAKVCLFPSLHEGWGIIPMESLACGTPVVAYNLPVYSESLGSNSALKLVETGSESLFAKEAVKILSSPTAKVNWKPVSDWADVARVEWRLICQP